MIASKTRSTWYAVYVEAQHSTETSPATGPAFMALGLFMASLVPDQTGAGHDQSSQGAGGQTAIVMSFLFQKECELNARHLYKFCFHVVLSLLACG